MPAAKRGGTRGFRSGLAMLRRCASMLCALCMLLSLQSLQFQGALARQPLPKAPWHAMWENLKQQGEIGIQDAPAVTTLTSNSRITALHTGKQGSRMRASASSADGHGPHDSSALASDHDLAAANEGSLPAALPPAVVATGVATGTGVVLLEQVTEHAYAPGRKLLHGSRKPWLYAKCSRCFIISCDTAGVCTGHCKTRRKLHLCTATIKNNSKHSFNHKPSDKAAGSAEKTSVQPKVGVKPGDITDAAVVEPGGVEFDYDVEDGGSPPNDSARGSGDGVGKTSLEPVATPPGL